MSAKSSSFLLVVSALCLLVDSQLPTVGLPNVGLPKMGVPKMDVPKMGIPKIGLPAITRIRPEELYDCPDSEDLSIHYKDIVLSYVGPDVVQVDGTIEILEPMERPVSLETKMYKCVSRSEPDTCEYYHTFRSPEVCTLLEVAGGRFWGAFTNSTNLPKECPFPQGTYNISKALMDMSDMKSVPVFESYWKLHTTAYHNSKKLMCVICEFSVTPVYMKGRH